MVRTLKKTRKPPLRQCIVTREQAPKEALIRVVKNKHDEVSIDTTGRAHGRGAYIKKDKTVIERARKRNAIAKHFKVPVDAGIYDDRERIIDASDA